MEKTLCCTLTPRQVVRASSQAIAINGTLMKQLCFPGSRQMLLARPHVTFTSLSSLVSSSPARHHICPRLWQSIVGVTLQLGSRPGGRYWPACMSPGTKVDPPPHDLHTHSALPCIVVGEAFRSFSENEDGMTQYKKILIGNVTLSLML